MTARGMINMANIGVEMVRTMKTEMISVVVNKKPERACGRGMSTTWRSPENRFTMLPV
jgi:hypothetical protein